MKVTVTMIVNTNLVLFVALIIVTLVVLIQILIVVCETEMVIIFLRGRGGGFIVKNQKARLCFYLILKACTSTRPLNDGCCSFKLGGCGENEGGCDDDSQCQGDLICGSGIITN